MSNGVKDYINLEMPSILGMGAVGPTLAVLTATVFSAVASCGEPPVWAYPAIMLVLSGLLAVFPVARAEYPLWQKWCLWPLVGIIIFASAWGTNHGLSAGEEALSTSANSAEVGWSFSLVSSAYAQDTNESVRAPIGSSLKWDLSGAQTNAVNFREINFDSKVLITSPEVVRLPSHVWGISWKNKNSVLLRDKDGKWASYTRRKGRPPEASPHEDGGAEQRQQQQRPLRGGFFKC